MTALRLYNTLTRTKDDFVPIDPNNVRMYVCGPTVYDFAHIGNARPAIVFDVLFRLLRHVYGPDHVTYVRNITDIDDKINARALEKRGDRNVPILDVVRELTEQTYGVYREDVTALGCLQPTTMPRATDYVPQMIAMTQALIDAGYAYPAEGHVLFDVEKKKDYGKLARRSLDDMIAGARVDVAPYKKNPMDFVLWKPSDGNTPGWDSPWGRGRPGWHLECSSMIEATMKGGDTIDIHGGGIDLVFPHHENEIAQSEGAHHGHPLAKVWMHNGFLNVEGEKMSKSLGNFVTINELLKNWDGRGLRVNMLKRHYRLPMDWTEVGMRESQNLLWEWEDQVPNEINLQARADSHAFIDGEVLDALSDDLNTHMALSRIHELSRIALRSKAEGDQLKLAASMDLLGLLPSVVRSGTGSAAGKAEARAVGRGLNPAAIERAIEARLAARKAKNFAESDRIRDELLAQGIVLKDTPQGTTWEVKR